MAKVLAKYPGEPVEAILKRFKKKVIKEGILEDIRRKEYFESPSVIRKRKIAQAKRLALKRQKNISK